MVFNSCNIFYILEQLTSIFLTKDEMAQFSLEWEPFQKMGSQDIFLTSLYADDICA